MASSVQLSAEPLPVPFDVTLAPTTLEVKDRLSQNVALQAALLAPSTELDGTESFKTQPRITKPLSFFRRLYKEKQSRMALDMLAKRVQVDFGSCSMTVPTDDPDLVWNLDNTYLDLRICVGADLGLGGLLPNQQVNHNYLMKLEFKREREFSPKFAILGFDPAGSMVWIGRSPASEDVWLAWAPREALQTACKDIPVGTCSGPSTMSISHYRMGVMFIAAMLQQIAYRDIVVSHDYPDLEDSEEFQFATNLL